MNERLIRPNDVTAMVESLEELFNEREKITPNQVAERMSKKIGRAVTYQYLSYITTAFGFITTIVHDRSECITSERFYIKDYDLLKKIKENLPSIESSCLASQHAPFSSELSFSRSKLDVMGGKVSG